MFVIQAPIRMVAEVVPRLALPLSLEMDDRRIAPSLLDLVLLKHGSRASSVKNDVQSIPFWSQGHAMLSKNCIEGVLLRPIQLAEPRPGVLEDFGDFTGPS